MHAYLFIKQIPALKKDFDCRWIGFPSADHLFGLFLKINHNGGALTIAGDNILRARQDICFRSKCQLMKADEDL